MLKLSLSLSINLKDWVTTVAEKDILKPVLEMTMLVERTV